MKSTILPFVCLARNRNLLSFPEFSDVFKVKAAVLDGSTSLLHPGSPCVSQPFRAPATRLLGPDEPLGSLPEPG